MFETKLAAAADLFRPRAAARDLPPEDVDAFIRCVRPAVHVTEGDGPLRVGRMGGAPMLPPDAPEPSCRFVFSIDCASLPAGATDLPLPPDGELLFFAELEQDGNGDTFTWYVPSATPTRHRPCPEPSSTPAAYRQRPLQMTGSGLSAPDSYRFAEQRWKEGFTSEQENIAHMLGETWQQATDPQLLDAHGFIQLGGNSRGHELDLLLQDEEGDDWVDLATWTCQSEDLDNIESATIVWEIRREDLAARRFDNIYGHQDQ
ncbi:hypothetical protein GCM10010277_80600 [Streptomyces longisporoflavus]|uniref:DUF1963 domain-containing protein n=1 Tax=Streptomyces longisporoflavus TaxID=28044 RepID=UPI00167CCE9A|nr:DUF1963 domain-containing protein [Streptomyces longisporoflavus]GGV70054.1 hypothetical protein GCM10010277_80600 [Streptomyces longisporoflavus]